MVFIGSSAGGGLFLRGAGFRSGKQGETLKTAWFLISFLLKPPKT
jgi:hypothetical protein